jgi:glucokinase
MTSSLDSARAGSPVRSRQTGLLLAGDIGGTKTALGLYSADRGPRTPLFQAEYPSAKYSSLEAVVREFLATAKVPVERACFAVAGPVIAGSSEVTNLPWLLRETELETELQLEAVHLVNDLEAIADAMTILSPEDLYPLNQGEATPGGARAVIAPGTGLGEAFLIWDGSRYRAFPSEGGHADFAPTTELQAGLLVHLLQKFSHVSVERVCSGPGLLHIYRYLRDSGQSESPELSRALAATPGNNPALIGEAALRPSPDPLARAALDLFASILGAEAGNLALKVLSTGGLYLAGGIPQRILPALEDGRFMRAFTAKGRFRELLSRVPVYVVALHAALIGAAHRGLATDGEAEGRRVGGIGSEGVLSSAPVDGLR